MTGLHISICENNILMVKLLCEYGSDLEFCDIVIFF
jgi:hypothetical protein